VQNQDFVFAHRKKDTDITSRGNGKQVGDWYQVCSRGKRMEEQAITERIRQKAPFPNISSSRRISGGGGECKILVVCLDAKRGGREDFYAKGKRYDNTHKRLAERSLKKRGKRSMH